MGVTVQHPECPECGTVRTFDEVGQSWWCPDCRINQRDEPIGEDELRDRYNQGREER